MCEENYRLTPWWCLMATLRDYNVDTTHVTPKMGEHIVNDFMELMVKQGYITKGDDNED